MATKLRSEVVLGLFESYFESVYVLARRSLDASGAEEVAQEVFAGLLEVPGLEEERVTEDWLRREAQRVVMRRRRCA
jgi:DNA-directed RNA polymerase specialized sigma24 family protein